MTVRECLKTENPNFQDESRKTREGCRLGRTRSHKSWDLRPCVCCHMSKKRCQCQQIGALTRRWFSSQATRQEAAPKVVQAGRGRGHVAHILGAPQTLNDLPYTNDEVSLEPGQGRGCQAWDLQRKHEARCEKWRWCRQ